MPEVSSRKISDSCLSSSKDIVSLCVKGCSAGAMRTISSSAILNAVKSLPSGKTPQNPISYLLLWISLMTVSESEITILVSITGCNLLKSASIGGIRNSPGIVLAAIASSPVISSRNWLISYVKRSRSFSMTSAKRSNRFPASVILIVFCFRSIRRTPRSRSSA